MSTKRNFSAIALLGGSTAALAMLTGLAGARADDLKVNQQLLSDRLDQLAAVGLGAGGSGNPYLSIDQGPAAGTPVTGGSFPRSILIPGTETSLKIYGEIREITDYWMSGGPTNGSPQSTTVGATGQLESISLHGTQGSARSNGIFQTSPRESKIGFETRTPTAFGEARTVMEFDWAGSTAFAPGGTDPAAVSDSLLPRLRYGYGTLGGFLAGQATSNFADPDANGETLDFGGNVGEPGKVRVPQLRYTMPAWWGGSFSISAETPETQLGTQAGVVGSDAGVIPTVTCAAVTPVAGVAFTPACAVLTSGQVPTNTTKSTAPNLTAAYYLPQPWGHFNIGAVVLPGQDIDDGKFLSRSFVGFGGHIGMDIKPGWFGWAKDDFIFHIVGGDAIGTYLNASTNYSLASNIPATFAATTGNAVGAVPALNIIIKPTTEWGGEVGYQHWWADNLRSNINYGINHHDIPANLIGAAQAGAQNLELMNAHLNLIWNPVSFVDIGLEYTWGQRQTVAKTSATENALISKFGFKF
jgi:hypothetical protein